MDKLFRQVSVKERLPSYLSLAVITNIGIMDYQDDKWYFKGKEFMKTGSPDWWMEEITIPNEISIDAEAHRAWHFSEHFAFKNGAKWALNTLKGEKI